MPIQTYYGELITNHPGFKLYDKSDEDAIKQAQKIYGNALLCLYRYKNNDPKDETFEMIFELYPPTLPN